MQLNDATMAIRPRSAWEALDLGILLARRHAKLLMLSWALLTLPVFVLISLLLWQHPTLSLLLFWWCKPLYERLPLYILSRSLFGDTPTLHASFRALPGVLRPQWFSSMTWRRFSLTRSFDLPVVQLEGLSGSTRQQRLTVLRQRDSGPARWLTIVGAHLESGLWLGAIALLYILIPQQLLADWTWRDLLELDGNWLWFEHLTNLLYVLVLMIWEPIYVASGFSLYLNRRTILEAWDIELSFRRLLQRLTPLLPALVLALGLILNPFVMDVEAAPEGEHTTTVPGAESERLLNQPLTSTAAQEQISQLLDQPPFRNQETVTRWRFGDEQTDAEPGWLARLLDSLLGAGSLQRSISHLAAGIEALLWAALFGLTAYTIWRYRDWLRLHAPRFRVAGKTRQRTPAVLFGLEVQPESLPRDVASEAERLWLDSPRKALGLLYRALLSHLLHDHKLPLRTAHTEGEILELLRQHDHPALLAYAQTLTEHWLNLAYGHQVPPISTKDQLCGQWRAIFGAGALQ
ncbi:DUF4129 domain-containing protein [Stutzerimonas stutzeri]|uniref:DUF4129 domain-containing protein n=1 Tax=Stutzerimonas stutzeri TaxID=316 RepID=UPI00210C9B40|nr:DUF4129 domain-containing protein [Stutzerimonas stutzeri]MCQ4258493.1 DUF4129 domain-containing protein [Stutzerimonas stutzeri]